MRKDRFKYYLQLLDPISVLIEDTEAMVPTVRNQDVPDLVHLKPSRITELSASLPCASKLLDWLLIVWTDNINPVQP